MFSNRFSDPICPLQSKMTTWYNFIGHRKLADFRICSFVHLKKPWPINANNRTIGQQALDFLTGWCLLKPIAEASIILWESINISLCELLVELG